MTFQSGRQYKTILHCCLLHTLQTHRLRTNSLTTFSSREGINSRCRRFTAVVAVHVVPVPTARWRSTVTTVCCGCSVHCRSGWSVAMNHDCSYRRHWFYLIDHSHGRRGIRYSFGCFSRIQKMLERIETRTRDRIYSQTIRTVRDFSRDDRARITTCGLRTPTDRQIKGEL